MAVMLFAAKVWHFWLGMVLFVGTIIPIALLLIGYLVKVQAPQYERRRRRPTGEQPHS